MVEPSQLTEVLLQLSEKDEQRLSSDLLKRFERFDQQQLSETPETAETENSTYVISVHIIKYCSILKLSFYRLHKMILKKMKEFQHFQKPQGV